MEKKEKEVNKINEKSNILTEYKIYVKLLQKQKRMGLINKSEYNYLKTFYLINLSEK